MLNQISKTVNTILRKSPPLSPSVSIKILTTLGAVSCSSSAINTYISEMIYYQFLL